MVVIHRVVPPLLTCLQRVGGLGLVWGFWPTLWLQLPGILAGIPGKYGGVLTSHFFLYLSGLHPGRVGVQSSNQVLVLRDRFSTAL